jgi:hypothetical protein
MLAFKSDFDNPGSKVVLENRIFPAKLRLATFFNKHF